MGAVQRDVHVRVDRGRRAQVEDSSSHRQRVAVGAEVEAAHERCRTARRLEDLDQLGTGLPDQHGAARLYDAGLLERDVLEARTGELGVVHADVGDHRDLRVDDVGRVPSSEQADLDDDDVDGDVCEPAKGSGRHDLEVAGPLADDRLEFGDRGDLFGQLVVGDRLAVALDPFVDPLEMGTGVGADREAVRSDQSRDHLDCRALAVRAGHVDHRRRVLRIAEHVAESGDQRERRFLDTAGLLVRRVVVEVGQGIGEVGDVHHWFEQDRALRRRLCAVWSTCAARVWG